MEANAPEPVPATPPSVGPAVRPTTGGFWRNLWKIALGATLALGVFALLVALSLAQFASRDVSQKVLRRAVATLTEQFLSADVESLAVVFLFSFRNPAHERRAAEVIRALCPELPLSLRRKWMKLALVNWSRRIFHFKWK